MPMRVLAGEPVLVRSMYVDGTLKDGGPGQMGGVEVGVGYHDCFQAAFGFDLRCSLASRLSQPLNNVWKCS